MTGHHDGPAAVAFRKAQAVAATSRVARLVAAPVDLSHESGELPVALDTVRATLVAAQRADGARMSDDPDGDQFRARHPEITEDEFWSLVNTRDEAGYLYGLALGLLLGKGGAR